MKHRTTGPCPGPLVWFDVLADERFPVPSALLECSACGYVVTSGNANDEAHAFADLLREGIVS